MKIYLSVFLLVISVLLSAQDEDLISNSLVIPPPPEASHLGMYGEVPVGLSTGTVNVAVPIFDISEGGISIPISVSYQSHGLRINEQPSWVGMGWSLIAGGVISRTQRGLPDEAIKGYFNKNIDMPDAALIAEDMSNEDTDTFAHLRQITDNEYDFVPDLYSYNFGGNGGSFFFGNDGGIHCAELNEMKFEPIWDLTDNYGMEKPYEIKNDIQGWRVTDTNGLIYEFNVIYDLSAVEQTEVETPQGREDTYNSAWHLTKIINPRTDTQADFTYDDTYRKYSDQTTSQTDTYQQIGNGTTYGGKTSQSQTTTVISKDLKFLESITLNDHVISFQNQNAYSYSTGSGYVKLNSITWQNGNSSKVASFDIGLFSHVGNTSEHKRLKLNSILVDDLEYSFDYISGVIPPRHDNDQDHWGFYNGAGNSSLIPEVVISGVKYVGGNADREVNEAFSKFGMLEKITYPTKGSTKFTYEQNTYEGVSSQEEVEQVIQTDNLDINTAGESVLGWHSEMTDGHPVLAANKSYRFIIDAEWVDHDPNEMPNFYPYLEVTDLSSTVLQTTILSDGTLREIIFDAASGGAYFFKVYAHRTSQKSQEVEATVRLEEHTPADVGSPIARPVGGLRIKRIDNYDPVTTKTETKTFDYGNGGYLVWSLPHYYRFLTAAQDDPDVWGKRVESGSLAIGSGATRGLAPSAIPVAYETVKEWKGTASSNIGSVTTTFQKTVDLGATHTIQESQAWKRSKVKKELYKNANDVPVQEVIYGYSAKTFPLAKGFRSKQEIAAQNVDPDFDRDYSYHNFTLSSNWHELTSKKTILYDDSFEDNGSGIFQQKVIRESEEVIDYASILHLNPTQITTVSSEGESLQKRYEYPIDSYSCNHALSEDHDPADDYCIQVYLVSLTTCDTDEYNRNPNSKSSGQTTTLCNGCYEDWLKCHMKDPTCTDLLTYNETYKTCVNTQSYIDCMTNESNEFQLCQQTALATFLACKEGFENCLNDLYDPLHPNDNFKGLSLMNVMNIKTIPSKITVLKDDEELSETEYKFLVNNEHPLPDSISVTYREVDTETLLTVADYDGKGNPLAVIDHSSGTTKTYIWGYGGTRIVAQIHGENSAVDIGAGLNANVIHSPSSDTELRTELAKLYQEPLLDGTLITTYTYHPIDGVTSQTDPNGRVTKYEYENGRMTRVIDHDGNVIQEVDYNFKSP